MLIEGEDFANRPWGIVGEPAAPRPPEPPAQVRQPIVVPPPPWSPNYVPELDPDYEPSELREDEESYPAKRKAES
jgi:hypothetical protein